MKEDFVSEMVTVKGESLNREGCVIIICVHKVRDGSVSSTVVLDEVISNCIVGLVA